MYSENAFIKSLRFSLLLEEEPSKLSMAAFKEVSTLETFSVSLLLREGFMRAFQAFHFRRKFCVKDVATSQSQHVFF